MLMLCSCFVGCDFKSDVDLNNIDCTTSIKTSLSLPIGSMYMDFGDFVGTSNIPKITIDEQGRYSFRDTIHSTKSYHPINIADYITTTSSRWEVADQLHQIKSQLEAIYPFLGSIENIPLPITLPQGLEFEMDFPIDIDLKKFNIDYNYQRVDSVIVDLARFTSVYSLENINLNWSDVQSIELILSDKFRRKDGNSFTLPLEGNDFGKPLPISIDNFHLILMEDPTKESGAENIVDSISLKIRFNIKTSQPLTLDYEQYISYDFEINFIEYSAMFGYFAASSMMRDAKTEQPIEQLWADWNIFNEWMLPVSEPSVKFIVDHTLAIPMEVTLNHLYTMSQNGERRDATFDESHLQKTKTIHLPMQIAVTDPLEKHAFDSIILDYNSENGNIDTLFSIHPYAVSYDFNVATDNTTDIKQFRITDNTNINLSTIMDIPFSFNDSVIITHSDTIKDIDLTTMQLDSLLENVQAVQEIEDLELKLVFYVQNKIPFNIEANFTLYDANDEVILLSNMLDTSCLAIKLEQPTDIVNGVAMTPSDNVLYININKDDFDKLASVDHIVFNARLGENQCAVNITPEASLQVRVGVAAKVEAIVDLQKIMQL